MKHTRKTRSPSISYLEQQIAEIIAIANPTQDQIRLMAHYKQLLDNALLSAKAHGTSDV